MVPNRGKEPGAHPQGSTGRVLAAVRDLLERTAQR